MRKVDTKLNLADLGMKIFGPTAFERLRELNGYQDCTVQDRYPEMLVKKIIGGLRLNSNHGVSAASILARTDSREKRVEGCVRALVAAIMLCTGEGTENHSL